MTEQITPDKTTQRHVLDLYEQQKYEAAEKELFSALSEHPDWLSGWQLLVDVYISQGKDARLPALQALNLSPNNVDSHHQYGICLKKAGDLKGAIKAFKKANQTKSDNAVVYHSLALSLSEVGMLDESIRYFNKALSLKPDYTECFSDLLSVMTGRADSTSDALFEKHLDYAKKFELPLRGLWPAHQNTRDKEKNLKIGFVSADFREHSIASFFKPVLSQLALFPDLSLYAYSNTVLQDTVTQNIRRSFRHWRQVNLLSNSELASQIQQDEIDILVDLSGHSAGNRLQTFAMKPAPIQVSWLGNLYSSGLSAIDYYLADHHLAPIEEFKSQFSENILHLPSCTAFTPSDVAPEINDLPAIKNGFITFACFNRPNKITKPSVQLWANLLYSVEASKLLLAGMPSDGSYDEIIHWFSEFGISRDRLIFHPRSYMKHYLALHHDVDICLDTIPSNGFTTVCHSAWMGVPTLCIAGDRTTSRSAMTIMRHLGLNECIADDQADFVALGKALASSLENLAFIRKELRQRFNDSPIADAEQIAAALSAGFRQMWNLWCDAKKARSFTIEADINNNKGNKNDIIYVTQPILPELSKFIPYLEKIWDKKILTNGGPFHQQLEKALCDYLGVKHIALFANGTLALLTAIQSLRVTGEVITTPYSFVATSHSLMWNGIKPVFVDIDPKTLNMDPEKIEAAITSKTTAIMPVHCYGYPCDVDAIQKVADKYNLKIIYDAAHAFGVQHKKQSLLKFGDLSILSFHATKVFNTFEGGAIICPDAKSKQHIDHLKNFGFVDEVTVVASGINGKMSEMNAAFGLLQLQSVDEALEKRRQIDEYYRLLLNPIDGIDCVVTMGAKNANYSYFPILVLDSYPLARDELYNKLKDAGIYARRYFYPLISDFPMYREFPSAHHDNLPVAAKVSQNVICLPIYPALGLDNVERIVKVIASAYMNLRENSH